MSDCARSSVFCPDSFSCSSCCCFIANGVSTPAANDGPRPGEICGLVGTPAAAPRAAPSRPVCNKESNLPPFVINSGFSCACCHVGVTIFGCAATGACALLLRSEEHTSELQSLRHLVCR